MGDVPYLTGDGVKVKFFTVCMDDVPYLTGDGVKVKCFHGLYG